MSFGQAQVSCEGLIALVQERPPLYDYSHPAHYNRDVTSRLWTEIADKLSVPEIACKTKWANLRSNFVRELRRLRPAEDGKMWPPQWPLFKPLMFLMPYLKSRGSKEPPIDDPAFQTLEFEDLKRPCEDLSAAEVVVESKRLKFESVLTVPAEEEPDDDKLFMLSLVPKMRQLSTVDNLSFRIDVQQLLLNRLCQPTPDDCETAQSVVMICESEEDKFSEITELKTVV